MTKPKKLIRSKVVFNLQPEEVELIQNQDELNHLYELKIKEEMNEINSSFHKDVYEFADLIEVVIAYAKSNGFTAIEIFEAIEKKNFEKGSFSNVALNNLNPSNPSNQIYFNK